MIPALFRSKSHGHSGESGPLRNTCHHFYPNKPCNLSEFAGRSRDSIHFLLEFGRWKLQRPLQIYRQGLCKERGRMDQGWMRTATDFWELSQEMYCLTYNWKRWWNKIFWSHRWREVLHFPLQMPWRYLFECLQHQPSRKRLVTPGWNGKYWKMVARFFLLYTVLSGRAMFRWMFPKIGVPQNGWFIMENPTV